VHEVDRCLVNLEILAKTMHEYVDWSEMEKGAFDSFNQSNEDNRREL
jgi:hypothetical protein